ncbi:hypothetical protein SAMN02745883_00709 [Caminicella sporogenes DSM 14501]|uniref:Uncharacterized protein n=1 Tax=Caminicella sporogenes DSM 14501 TaxID=1121266 RepID=A0A1M6MYY2_9FIRM|nr:hypothetical protein [Caminicella sporogenes]RKD22439.1 hypothetical protein BET04_05245 [Caminicella sporogenes]SHJ88592.1 hypothetical protein SAMN02745883_00709 [Caminicella sporogenes DSM 14501]
MINEIIKDVLSCNHIQTRPIENFTIEQLKELANKAEENNLLITISAEYSNFHQGVLVNLVRKDIAEKLLQYL